MKLLTEAAQLITQEIQSSGGFLITTHARASLSPSRPSIRMGWFQRWLNEPGQHTLPHWSSVRWISSKQ